MSAAIAHPVVHLELQTSNLARACAFYTGLFGWSAETIRAGERSYLVLDLSEAIQGGAVERETGRSLWLPYVEVENMEEATERARRLGGAVLLEPREGPAGWRGVVASPDAAEVALWQPKL